MITDSTPRSIASARREASGTGTPVSYRDVGWDAEQAAALLRRRVARAHADVRPALNRPRAFGCVPDAHERRPQVLLYVGREGAERRDVQDAGARLRVESSSVASRSIAQRNAASVLPDPVGRAARCGPRRRSPSPGLGGRRRVERLGEPIADGRREGASRASSRYGTSDRRGAGSAGPTVEFGPCRGLPPSACVLIGGAARRLRPHGPHRPWRLPAGSAPGAAIAGIEDQVMLSGTLAVPRGQTVGGGSVPGR